MAWDRGYQSPQQWCLFRTLFTNATRHVSPRWRCVFVLHKWHTHNRILRIPRPLAVFLKLCKKKKTLVYTWDYQEPIHWKEKTTWWHSSHVLSKRPYCPKPQQDRRQTGVWVECQMLRWGVKQGIKLLNSSYEFLFSGKNQTAYTSTTTKHLSAKLSELTRHEVSVPADILPSTLLSLFSLAGFPTLFRSCEAVWWIEECRFKGWHQYFLD